ncbi:hypothetical protein [Hydrogenophaga sp.]|uniref:hypothetical protein n=1 Tax=Hydrogenophaga sp. TaxID=1904254 RepID=UPI003569710C
MHTRQLILVSVLAGLHLAAAAAPEVQPARDDEVLEVLTVVTRNRPQNPAPNQAPTARAADPGAVALQARQDIVMARQTGDTRYWGRAQALLTPWWDRADAPTDLAVLQATVQQGRHEFEAARGVLTAALQRTPGHAQGWLNLAALERLSGRYAESLRACDAVARAGQSLYATACRLETQSLGGAHAMASQALRSLIAQAGDAGQRSWLLSLQAENLERWGHDGDAAQAYQSSLALQPDLYTAIAYSDLLLRTGQTAQAQALLAPLPETDAVLLRRATAWQRLGDPQWKAARAELNTRNTELLRRGDDPFLHGRELALAALWLDGDAQGALALARKNLLLQREPLDWWVAVQSAQRAKDAEALREITLAIQAVGLLDNRLAPLPATASAPRSNKQPQVKP